MRPSSFPLRLAAWLSALSLSSAAQAGTIHADPTSYQAALATLQPGDTLSLAAGTYPLLFVQNLNGGDASPITIAGAAGGGSVVQGDANDNVVEIIDSSYVVIQGLTLDSMGLDGVFGVSAKGGTGNNVHHITIDGCTFTGQSASQQTDGISTKTPTWGWVIRNNVIDGAGTGLYLGNSDGSDPFVGGLIEGNLIQNTIGYDGEIKYQAPWPTGTGLPAGPNVTIVRNNVFIKNDQPSPDGDRPNLYLGGVPATGMGSGDLFEVYGNLFFHNPRESLLQFEGRVSVHDNVFVDANLAAIAVQTNDLPVELARVYNNTIYTTTNGIQFSQAASQGDFVVGNLVFGGTPISGHITTNHDNVTDTLANAVSYVNDPSMTLGSMDFYPSGPKTTGPSLDLSSVATDVDYDEDFNGTSKGQRIYRGAYAGQGKNPGWPLGDGPKSGGPDGAGGGSSAGTAGSPASDAGTGDAGAAGGAAASATRTSGGCKCSAPGGDGDGSWGAAAAALAALGRRASRRRRR